jgi:hypothetical protein
VSHLILDPGVYEHYKGGKYTVLFNAHDSTNKRVDDSTIETSALSVVVYVSHTTGRINVRDLDEFTEFVVWPDGVKRQRFELRKTL